MNVKVEWDEPQGEVMLTFSDKTTGEVAERLHLTAWEALQVFHQLRKLLG